MDRAVDDSGGASVEIDARHGQGSPGRAGPAADEDRLVVDVRVDAPVGNELGVGHARPPGENAEIRSAGQEDRGEVERSHRKLQHAMPNHGI